MNDKMIEITEKAVRKDKEVGMADLLNQELTELQKAMIEEMAKVIDDRLIEANNYLGSMNKGKGYWIAQKLVEHYQSKISEGAVVLSNEEYSDYLILQKNHEFIREKAKELQADNERLYNNLGKFKESVRKETAKEIFYKLKETLIINNEENTEFFDYDYTLETIDKLANQFGVEV